MDQMLRLLHECGLPMEDVDFINSDGKTMNKLLLEVGSLFAYNMFLLTCLDCVDGQTLFSTYLGTCNVIVKHMFSMCLFLLLPSDAGLVLFDL